MRLWYTHLSVECSGGRVTIHARKVFTLGCLHFYSERFEFKLPNAPRLLGTLNSTKQWFFLSSVYSEIQTSKKLIWRFLIKLTDSSVLFLSAVLAGWIAESWGSSLRHWSLLLDITYYTIKKANNEIMLKWSQNLIWVFFIAIRYL